MNFPLSTNFEGSLVMKTIYVAVDIFQITIKKIKVIKKMNMKKIVRKGEARKAWGKL